jgi:hypothetical protein
MVPGVEAIVAAVLNSFDRGDWQQRLAKDHTRG